MTYRTLLALALPLVIALPISAAPWSDEAKKEFTTQCITGAPAGFGEEQIVRYCDCAAGSISQEFSEEELKALASQTSPDNATQQRLIKATGACAAILQS